MSFFGGTLGFATPWILAGLFTLPFFWWLFRVLPPKPTRITFPGLFLLADKNDHLTILQSSPLWLILMRLFTLACLIIGVASPFYHDKPLTQLSDHHFVILDNAWSSQSQLAFNQNTLITLQEEADIQGQSLSVIAHDGHIWRSFGQNEIPPSLPWVSDWSHFMPVLNDAVGKLPPDTSHDVTIIAGPARTADQQSVLASLSEQMTVTLVQPTKTALGNALVFLDRRLDGAARLRLKTASSYSSPASETSRPALQVVLKNALSQTLARIPIDDTAFLDEGQRLDLPNRILNATSLIHLQNSDHIGGVFYTDAQWGRKSITILRQSDLAGAALPFLDTAFFTDRALNPFADLSIMEAEDPWERLESSMIILPDGQPLDGLFQDRLWNFVEQGGVLLRFASADIAENPDQLLPIGLRPTYRNLDSDILWANPEKLAAFSENSPFFGLDLPHQDLKIRHQALADPQAIETAGSEIWARLTDKTPIVSARSIGDGYLVLMHVSANLDDSDLPISGLFVEMLRRMMTLDSVTSKAMTDDTLLTPLALWDGRGQEAPWLLERFKGQQFTQKDVTSLDDMKQIPPGLYGFENQVIVRNFSPFAQNIFTEITPPQGVRVLEEGASSHSILDLSKIFLVMATMAFLIDCLYRLGAFKWLLTRVSLAGKTAALLILAFGLPFESKAQGLIMDNNPFSTRQITTLPSPELVPPGVLTSMPGYVLTGNDSLDQRVGLGLLGLANILNQRTSIEASEPKPVRLEQDDLAFHPFLYWAITDQQVPISPVAAERLNRYMDLGGTLIIDLVDDAQSQAEKPNPSTLRNILYELRLPALQQVPPDHVLGRSFYLLSDFPGRFQSQTVWIEKLEDNHDTRDQVARVIMGSNDWSAAWAMDDRGRPVYSLYPGGLRQRELAARFGVNLAMYVLTGNYKSDQVHIGTILERLGQ